MIKYKNKLFEEALPRQTTVDQLHRIRDEINKSQIIKIGPEETIMGGDVGDRVIGDLKKHKMNNLFYWDNPLDRHIDSYETFIQGDNKDSLGYTKDSKEKSNRGVDVPDRLQSEVPKPKNDMTGKNILEKNLLCFSEFNIKK